MTLLDMFRMSAGRVPERPAFLFRERRLTYRELDDAARAVAGLLSRAGVRPRGACAPDAPQPA
ncbi:MAG TPA: AMP-binding protein, partial [Candidatus Methylomirabilis sp.]